MNSDHTLTERQEVIAQRPQVTFQPEFSVLPNTTAGNSTIHTGVPCLNNSWDISSDENHNDGQEKNEPRVKRRLKSRHLQMVAIGGTIGTGLFVGSGATIATAGPLGSLIGFLTVGIMVYFITTSLGELAAYMPVSGSFNTYAGRFVDPALAFALGWNYWLQWAISLPSELAAAGIIMSFWCPTVPSWVWSAIILGLLVLIHSRGVEGFGESEYWLSIIKVVAIVLFIISGTMVDLGWIGTGPMIGFDNWKIEGAPLKNGIVGIFNVFVVAFYGFGGTELVGVTAGEAINPSKNVPKAIKQTFWRILLFYVIAIFVMGLVVRNDDPSLLDSANKGDITIAPFTLVFERAGLSSAAHVMNGVIFSAVLSASSSAMYAATRTLMSLAHDEKAPAILGKINSKGVPTYSLILTTLIGCLAFLSTIWGDGEVFTWLLNITGSSGIITWLSIAVIHIRFRRAFQLQKESLDRLPYLAPLYPFGPWIAMFIGAVIITGQIYAAIMMQPFQLQNVIAVFIGMPFFFTLYFFYKFTKNTKLVDLYTCDLSGGDNDDYPINVISNNQVLLTAKHNEKE
ncbi:hypothetical protein BDV3_002196 [Batrachochytrium dendrobatidis]|uniref:Amino acid permease/ SLC12A domain-containing protein n=1 Tax=Batrachochytrium dendrobatidis (strain JEL423) TaxID=403673 RepID=A0A177WV32_BATDL|nr:hypothetical protein O5D80_007098 [Batrachochytrium dendrobatidis]KAK5664664.1 hypothetical protein QVD99_008215 [Batrachochytrium dendrobatidis]KAK5664676.1 hypothetical protein QVD99_008225 [Batrachochytrium dendrobatidis]OAJ43756.1 hypothetical protein BDEG_27084 [Batrachochytrium dendrobatidis JEL423]